MEAIMAILGVRGTGEFSTDFRPTNYRELYTFLEPNGQAPLQALIAMSSSESTDDPKYNNFRDELPDQVSTVNGAVADTSTGSITLDANDDNQFLVSGTIVVNATTGEVMHVTADCTGTALTVTRNIGGTSFQIADGAELFVAGHAAKEGSDTPTPISFDATLAYNYTQIFRKSFSVTGTLANTMLRTGPKEDEQRVKALKLHMSDIERAFFFGTRHIANSSTAEPTRYTGGLINTLSNVIDISSATSGVNANANKMTEEEFDVQLIDNVFAYGSKEKIAFIGSTVAHHLNWFGKDRWSPTQVDDAYGINFTRYRTPAGDLLVYLHPMFRQVPGMKESMLILDMQDVCYRYMQNRDTQLLRDRQGNGEDRRKHEFLTECGLELKQEKTHTYIKGWASRAAS
jgi:hypothetical protein